MQVSKDKKSRDHRHVIGFNKCAVYRKEIRQVYEIDTDQPHPLPDGSKPRLLAASLSNFEVEII